MSASLTALWIGYLADLVFGDPIYPFHPVRLFGKEIAALDKGLRKVFPKTSAGERAAGTVLVCIMLLTAFAVPFLILLGAYHVHRVLGIFVEGFFCWQLLAAKSLKTESMKVYTQLEKGSLPGAKKALSMIVGRDVDPLSEEGVVKADVETIAENASDGCIAPLFYMVLFGAVGGFVYKAVNTMDSMIGYRNDRYRYFGTAAARTDDVLNFLPSRICALIMLLCARGREFDHAQAEKIFRRDRGNSASPNAGQTESVMAGTLDLQLGGDASYFGRIVHKKTMGDAIRNADKEDIPRANRLLYRTVSAAMLFGTGIRLLLRMTGWFFIW